MPSARSIGTKPKRADTDCVRGRGSDRSRTSTLLIGGSFALCRADCLERMTPGDELIEHRVGLALVPGVRLERAKVLEVREQREHHLGADGRDHKLGHDQSEVLYR